MKLELEPSLNIIKFSLQKPFREMETFKIEIKLEMLHWRHVNASRSFKTKSEATKHEKVSNGFKSFEFYSHKKRKLFLFCTLGSLYLGKSSFAISLYKSHFEEHCQPFLQPFMRNIQKSFSLEQFLFSFFSL